MHLNKMFKVWMFVILFFVVIVYLGYSFTKMTDGDPNERCTRVELTVEEGEQASFVSREGVEEKLLKDSLYPEGKLMRDIDVSAIENSLKSNQFISQIECYKTNNGMPVGEGKVCIKVWQRTPVIYVLPDNQPGYYVDTQGTVLRNTLYNTNLLVATGKIDKKFAVEQLAPFAEYVNDNKFWNDQIEQVYVDRNLRNDPVVSLIPRVGDHVIQLGSLENYETKLRRMEIFYEKGLSQVGWNKYKVISVEFANQVVCTKR